MTLYVIRSAPLLGARAIAGRETAKLYLLYSSQPLSFYTRFEAGRASVPDQVGCSGGVIEVVTFPHHFPL